jgi:hypothetical protein
MDMSEDTKRKLQEALQEHLRDENEDGEERVVTEFVLTAAFINLSRPADSVHGYFHECHGPIHAVMGLDNIQSGWLEEFYAEPESKDPGY